MDKIDDLITHYKKYFNTVNANSSRLKHLAFQLRHQVYFDEYGYTSADSEAKDLEKDQYDDFSLHSLLFHKPTNKAIGNVRLITATDIDQLPISEYCSDLVTEPFAPQEKKTGEISRMSIHPSFRRRKSDKKFQISDEDTFLNNQRFSINYLPICVALAALSLMFSQNLDSTVALMEKRLAILIQKFGFKVKVIGKPINHYGTRFPYQIYVQETYNNLNPEYKALFHVIQEELEVIHEIESQLCIQSTDE